MSKITILPQPSKDVMKQMAQSFKKTWQDMDIKGYSEAVDQQFKSTTICIHQEHQLVSHLDIIDSGKNHYSPITTLPAMITFKDGSKKLFSRGIRNDKKELNTFIRHYSPIYKRWGEGRLFYSSNPNHTQDLIRTGYQILCNKNWDGVFALAENKTKMSNVLKKAGFSYKNSYIDSIIFLKGEFINNNNKVIKIPAFTRRNKLIEWKLFFLKSSNMPIYRLRSPNVGPNGTIPDGFKVGWDL